MKTIVSIVKQCGVACTILMLLVFPHIAYGQEGCLGNTTIFEGTEMAMLGNYSFITGGTGTQPGIVGTVRSGSYGVFSFGSGVTHSGADDAHHVDGYVRKYGAGQFIFPVGDNGFYGPFAANADGTTGAYFHVNPTSAITSNLAGGNYGPLPGGISFPASSVTGLLMGVSTHEYWDIDGSNATTITLTWDAGSSVASLVANNLNNLTIAGWNGTAWQLIASTVDPLSILGGASSLTAGSITMNNPVTPNSFTVYSLGSLTTPLPVHFISFDAYRQGNSAQLEWKAITDSKNDLFEIEHSRDARIWNRISTMPASMLTDDYFYVHNDPAKGLNYYRLKMMNADGSFGYSVVRSLFFDSERDISVFPNPAHDHIFIRCTDPETMAGVALYGMDGKQVRSAFPLKNEQLDIADIAPGHYILTVVYHNGMKDNRKIVIQ